MNNQGYIGDPTRHGLSANSIHSEAPHSSTKQFFRTLKYNMSQGFMKAIYSPSAFLSGRKKLEPSSELIRAMDTKYHILTDLKSIQEAYPKVMPNIVATESHLKRAETSIQSVLKAFQRKANMFDAKKVSDGFNATIESLDKAIDDIVTAKSHIPNHFLKLQSALSIMKGDIEQVRDRVEDYADTIPIEYVGNKLVVTPESLNNIKNTLRSYSHYITLISDIYLD